VVGLGRHGRGRRRPCVRGVWWYRRRHAAKAAQAEPPLPPDIRALKPCRPWSGSTAWRRGEAKRHYVALSEIFKDYAAGRYGVDTLDKTATELWAILKICRSARPADELKTFLDTGDLVKFAKHLPQPSGDARTWRFFGRRWK